jgi:hypothetical protein
MAGNSDKSSFSVTYPTAFTCDKKRIVACFLEHIFAEHFRDRFASPLVFIPDLGHPALYDVVRDILKSRAGEAGTFTTELNGSTLMFRVYDDRDHGIQVRLERTPSIRPSPIDTEATAASAP